MEQSLFWLVPTSSVLALAFAWYFHRQMMKESEGTPQMMKIAAAVRKGAMSYLKQQYKVVGIVFVCLALVFAVMAYGFHVQNSWVPIAFLTGGFFSGLSGFLGMKTATYASARTALASLLSGANAWLFWAGVIVPSVLLSFLAAQFASDTLKRNPVLGIALATLSAFAAGAWQHLVLGLA